MVRKQWDQSCELWGKRGLRERTGTVLACGVTALRSALQLQVARSIYNNRDSKLPPNTTRKLVLALLADKLDGQITDVIGGKTPIGGRMDETLDKVSNNLTEAAEAVREDDGLARFCLAIRLIRDLGVNAGRAYLAQATNGEVSTSANMAGKLSTTARGVAMVYRTTKHAERHPNLRRFADITSTTAVAASGIYNLCAYFRAKREWAAQQ